MPRKPTVSQAASEYVQLKGDKKRIEARLRELEVIIEPALREQDDLALELHGWRFTLVEYRQESFRLKDALEKLERRSLAPFITTSDVKQIRTSWQGGDAVDKAA